MSSSVLNDKKNLVILLLSIVSVVLLVLVVGSSGDGDRTSGVREGGHEEHATEAAQIWTCSMHPQIQLPKPGQCPSCGMDLIPMTEDLDTGGDWELTLSDSAQRLAEVQTASVERKFMPREIRMVGKVDYDEKRVSVISAWVPGRIDRLFVDFTGIAVNPGDHMVSLYSPDLVTAQQELRQALKTLKTGPDSVREATRRRVDAVREKLRLLGLSVEQIQEIEDKEKRSDNLTINSPIGGVVIKKHLNEGAYVQTGTPIYTIADLSRVWIMLEAYESDLAWLRFGQEVKFEVEAYPGEAFTGRIVFIDPVLDPRTRTVKIRMNIPNPDAMLKPDMFVRAEAHALISPGGKVMDPSLEGKWISPMHPEVVKEGPGSCDVCGMALVRAEDLGFAAGNMDTAPLVIPTRAALVTGERAVVYLSLGEGRFQGREVVLGPRAGDYYIVKSGLEEGEVVVTNGSFKIDSELQIRAKTSMMYNRNNQTKHAEPAKEKPQRLYADKNFSKALGPLLDAYFSLQKALGADELHAGHQAAQTLQKAVDKVSSKGLNGEALSSWDKERDLLTDGLSKLLKGEDLDQARVSFENVSESLYNLLKSFGAPSETYRFHCPMAFDNKGAYWLQNHPTTENPYFGAMMLRCGSQTEQLHQDEPKTEEGGHDHD